MNKERILKIIAIILAVLVCGNVVYLDIKVFSLGPEKVSLIESKPGVGDDGQAAEPVVPAATPTGVASDGYSCPLACREVVKSEIDSAIAALPTNAPAAVAQTKTPTAAPQITYLPLDGGSSTIERTWTEISGSDFIFDLADYPAAAKVYWQGNLKMQNAGSRCFTRLYDEDNKRGVDYSEQTTDKITYETLTSQPLAIWRGKNHYHVEIKSLDGSICYLDSPRLIIRY